MSSLTRFCGFPQNMRILKICYKKLLFSKSAKNADLKSPPSSFFYNLRISNFFFAEFERSPLVTLDHVFPPENLISHFVYVLPLVLQPVPGYGLADGAACHGGDDGEGVGGPDAVLLGEDLGDVLVEDDRVGGAGEGGQDGAALVRVVRGLEAGEQEVPVLLQLNGQKNIESKLLLKKQLFLLSWKQRELQQVRILS